MTRYVETYVSLEMLALWLLEFLLSFGLAYMLLSPGASASAIHSSVVNQAFILALTGAVTAFAAGLYRPEVFRRTRGLLINTALGGLLAFPTAWLVSKALGVDASRFVGQDAFWPTKMVVAWIATLLAIRLLFLAAVRSNMFVRLVAVLGPPGAVAATVAAVRHGHEGFIEVVSGPVAYSGPVGLRAAGVRNAVLPQASLTAMSAVERTAYAAEGIVLETEPEFWERRLKRVDVDSMDERWVAALDLISVGPATRVVNRAGDLLIGLGLLALTLPLMITAALLVLLTSPGPVLYRQQRVGVDGRLFTLWKFRSMRLDAEPRGPAWATQRDPRATWVGSFIRRTRIDELPQLINVLQGEMSVIGPRPERPHFVDRLADVIPYYQQRARVKPGLTGWAQVNFPYGASVEDARTKLSYDLYYVKHRSLLLDIAILFATVRVILFQEGSR